MDFEYVDKNANIVVAMSGGVDSSATLALLKDAGYKNIIGITLLLYDNDDNTGISYKDNKFLDDARLVAKKMGIEHKILDVKDIFNEKIITPFINSYKEGITPSPCVSCNRQIKFGALLDEAKKIGAAVLATGHYIKWQKNQNGFPEIHKNKELIRDQSYFLAKVDRNALGYMRFPLANMTKLEVRSIAEKFGLHVAQKTSSNDICFAGGKNYANLILKSINEEVKKGNIVDNKGNILGEHNGIFNYTVGQRKGLGLGGGEESAFYVLEIDKDNNKVVVGKREDLAKSEIIIKDVNWLGEDSFAEKERNLLVKVRASQLPIKAKIIPLDEGEAKVIFSEKVFGVAKGQICAMYDDDILMGGGNI